MKCISSFYIVLLTIIFWGPSSLFSSLVEGTLVKTPQGLVPVEKLRVGDTITTAGPYKTLIEARVLRIAQQMAHKKIIILTKRGSFTVSPDQLMYEYYSQRWILATSITDDHAFIDCNYKPCRCEGTTLTEEPIAIYQITVEFPHTLFISELQVATHNFMPLLQ